jgi:hypothetical protein
MKKCINSAFVLFVVLVSHTFVPLASAAEKHNIVVIMANDVGLPMTMPSQPVRLGEQFF